MKKILNSLQQIVPEMCHGMVLGYPDAGAYALGVIFTEITSELKEAN